MAAEYEPRGRNPERRPTKRAGILTSTALAAVIFAAACSNGNQAQESEGQDVLYLPALIQILRTADPSIRPVVLDVSNPIIIPGSPGQEARYRFFYKGTWTEVSANEVSFPNVRLRITSGGAVISPGERGDLDAPITSAKIGRHPGELVANGKKITMSVSKEPDNVY